jgi:hypothetical protein
MARHGQDRDGVVWSVYRDSVGCLNCPSCYIIAPTVLACFVGASLGEAPRPRSQAKSEEKVVVPALSLLFGGGRFKGAWLND